MNAYDKIADNLEKGHISQELALRATSTLDKLVKGGEGSRGGKVIGHTRTGKPIYEVKTLGDHDNFKKNHANFTPQDHKDAAELINDKNQGSWSVSKKHERAASKKEKGPKSSVVGKTSSGKSIYSDPEHSSHSNFTKQDHKDAADLYGKKFDENEESLGWHDAMNNSRTFAARKNASTKNLEKFKIHDAKSK